MAVRLMLVTASFIFLINSILMAQVPADSILERAYQNAKKGYWWALENIPKKKQQIGNDLITGNRLVSSVKLSKEINGIRVESTGYSETCEIKMLVYRSNDSLIKDGYIKTDTAIVQSKPDAPVKQIRKKKTTARKL